MREINKGKKKTKHKGSTVLKVKDQPSKDQKILTKDGGTCPPTAIQKHCYLNKAKAIIKAKLTNKINDKGTIL